MWFRAMKRCVLAAGLIAITAAGRAQDETGGKITIEAVTDFLEIKLRGTVPDGTTRIEYRLSQPGQPQPEEWSVLPAALDQPPNFSATLALEKSWRWSLLEARAIGDKGVLSATRTAAKTRALVLLTPDRLETLPGPERSAWESYAAASHAAATRDQDTLADECRALGRGSPQPAPASASDFKFDSGTPAEWFGSDEARQLAAVVLSFQTPAGGWSKAVDYQLGPRQPGMQWTSGEDPWHYLGTLDNRATTEQLLMLARVHSATGDLVAAAGALRGIDWLLAAQFPNGGWPQVYPLEPGYHEAITLNDGAMLHAMEVLQSVAEGVEPFAFVDAARREKAAAAYDRGGACLLAAQFRVEGKPAVWCAQHDPLTLAPAAARLKEPPSLSGGESAEILKHLMREGPLTAEVAAAIEHGLDWFERHKLTGLRQIKTPEGKTAYIEDPASGEVRWARFYDPATGKPMFAGAQDGIVYNTFQEMAAKNRVGYDYFTTKPAELLGKEAERWRKRLAAARR
jgi:PelA/Pel-15E family pectate lyase